MDDGHCTATGPLRMKITNSGDIVIVFLFKAFSLECKGRRPGSSRGSFSVPVGSKP